jgi:hypothetical protein
MLFQLLPYAMNSSIIPPLSVNGWKHYGYCVGPLATIRCKPRQARKGATVAADSCAGMWLAR